MSFSSTNFLVYHIPALCASLFLSTESRWRLVMPLGAISAFLMHPAGAQAWWYSLYWLIPTTIALWNPPLLIMQALGATFMAHAVGTVAYLYSGLLTPAHIVALTPLVFFERCMFACGISALVYSIEFIKQYAPMIYARKEAYA